MVTIITGTTNKPVASEELRSFFQTNSDLNGYLYIGYPIIGTVDGAYPIDGLWISPEKGLVVFNLIEGKETVGYEDLQDDCANKMEAKLKGYKQLMRRRTLCVTVNVITYAPTLTLKPETEEGYPLFTDDDSLLKYLSEISWENSGYYEALLSVLQAISTIRKGKKKRDIANPQSKGAKIRELEDSIANLDNHQSKAVIETVEGVQRIRGLAGSGKTIVLALKAAYLHMKHPEWKIAVTFNTRSLKGQFHQLINTFYIEQANEEPDWSNLHIIHAWGAPGGGEKNGLYYTFCSLNNVEYADYMTARRKYGTNDPFGYACQKALEDAKEMKPFYDAILVDEAQDFSPGFLRICYEMLNEPKRLVYAYDELQNLRTQSLPAPEMIFGNHADGTPRVRMKPNEDGKPQQDIILEKCYRNSRPVLVTAHALGFGIYRKVSEKSKESALVQMFDQKTLWEDIGYEVASGELEEGKQVVLQRNARTSPEFLETHSSIDDLIVFQSFESEEDQNAWVAQEIRNNLDKDELRPDDIIVINPNPVTTRKKVAPICSLLFQNHIASHIAGVDTTPDVFFAENNDSIAFTGIYRAKGNEAAMVYVINAQDSLYSDFNQAKVRNQLFTAITRSKAWVRVLGVGKDMEKLIQEYERVKSHDFTLDFIYPTEEQRNHMNIVNRDMSEAEKNNIRRKEIGIKDFIRGLKSGDFYLEDLDEDMVKELRDLLDSKGE